MNKNPMCDGSQCKTSIGEVRRLPWDTNSDGASILCRSCYDYEMRYRKREYPDMPRPEWNSLEIYTGM